MQKRTFVLLSILAVIFLSFSCREESTKTIEVFHKNKEPAMQTLERVDSVLKAYRGEYEISYFVITEPKNETIIERYNLPETHFPFAVVINGKYSARIDGNKIDFVHFPLFMHGIGRHEGNWSLDALERVLTDNSLLLKDNVLPELEHGEEDEECPE